ncbi:LysM peptidoglycan-binding domain-containing M23 family metallopeptidase [Spirochaeta lutea]|uniref:LysM domain-containing protein n=1 Tax=Spirochaeta lutea TaxID=1480694 RepID=A0A098R160_9SPIO|nr:LysM peptidoglycan-binding domain-containing M23 family metallopeptidase [Spirochaeta lutea]KGE73840.1 hypothetical protein DC28_01095 [Spirochaeta lutea]
MRQLSRAFIIGSSVIAMLVLLVPAVLPEQVYHQVEPGDTLYSIARMYGTEVELLKTQNDISDPSKLFVGQRLVIPSTHQVQAGDTYYSIARRYNMGLNELLELNNVDQNSVLRVGTVLTVSKAAQRSGETGSRGQNSSGQGDSNAPRVVTPSDNPGKSQDKPDSQAAGADRSQENRANIPTSSSVSGTMFESQVYRDETGTSWPVEGDRFTFSGKFPGISIMGQRGAPVLAVTSGRVIYSGPHSTLGQVTFVQHPRGYIYIYGGNETLLVSTGDEVKTGQQLGTLGITPVIQKPQLYFSVWKDGSYVDPASAPR